VRGARTPLDCAASSGHAGVVKLLVEADAKGSDAALKSAASGGDAGVVKAVLETVWGHSKICGGEKEQGRCKPLLQRPFRQPGN
jgi:hypothetical protein